MKRIMMSAALIASVMAMNAHTLDGIVKDNKTGEPLIGTVIRVKEMPQLCTTTGLDGSFTLHELPDRGKVTLIISYMSYKTKEMVVDVAKKKYEISLEEDAKQLGEVVVTGHWPQGISQRPLCHRPGEDGGQRAQRDEPAEHSVIA